MTSECYKAAGKKSRISGRRWTASILTALMIGAFLGSPAPKLLTDRILGTAATVRETMAQTLNLHNEMPQKPQSSGEAKDAAVQTVSGTQPDDSSVQPVVPAVQQAAPAAQPDGICLNANRGGIANRRERDVLIHLINAEANGLSYKAKVAVGQVVMNRWVGPYYGDDLLAIMTAPHQFTPIYDGSAYQKEIEPDSVKAADAVLKGTGVRELTDDTYYFVNPDFTEDKTIEQKMTFVCEIDGLCFYRPPGK